MTTGSPLRKKMARAALSYFLNSSISQFSPPLRLGLLCVSACAFASAAELFRDDFSRFPPGWLTSPVGALNAAIQEYHYLPHRGVPLGPWSNAI